MKAIQYGSLFSGVGAFEEALQDLGIPYNLVFFSEIDKYAIQSYCQAHDIEPERNLGDITKIKLEDLPTGLDLITYGFPCQDISVAGKGKGFEHDGKQTRSGLFYNAMDVIEQTEPLIAIAENVKNLVSKKFTEEFNIVLSSLELAGYDNKWQVLNSCDYGVPQNRERVFIVSLKGGDLASNLFYFAEGRPLHKCLSDILEDEVDEKYYLTRKQIEAILFSNYNVTKSSIHERGGLCRTLCARDYKGPKCVKLNG